MADIDLQRQLQARLAALKQAGIEWLPTVTDFSGLAIPLADGGGLAPPEEDPLVGRRRELTLLAEEVKACTRCPELASTRTQTVFGVGPIGAEICFIGEAPGADEDRQGEPFVGAAGQMLNRIITACGLTREEIFICNVLRCRPPGNRVPKPEEASNCREYLDRTLDIVKPQIICCWGGTAAKNLLNSTLSIGQLRGRFFEYRGIPVLCTYHPAFLLEGRSPHKKKDVWEDMKMMLAKMGREVPPVKKNEA